MSSVRLVKAGAPREWTGLFERTALGNLISQIRNRVNVDPGQDLEQFREVTKGEQSGLHICYTSLGKVTKPEVITV